MAEIHGALLHSLSSEALEKPFTNLISSMKRHSTGDSSSLPDYPDRRGGGAATPRRGRESGPSSPTYIR